MKAFRHTAAESEDIGAIRTKVIEFSQRLAVTKARVQLPDIGWYPYSTLSSLSHWDNMLTGERRFLLSNLPDSPVLDLGCGDGDLSFFLESLGLHAHAVDHAATNFNRMEGVRSLKAALHSSVEIHAADLDSQFDLPLARYGLTVFWGVLYHLKNPVYVLERLAERSKYCLLSTRVASSSPGKRGDLSDLPVAYLLDEGETNADATNYWIFSERGLKRLLHRTGWCILDYLTIGDSQASDPVGHSRDQRACCLLESAWVHDIEVDLGRGWHSLEFGSWRWTERVFQIGLHGTDMGARTLTFCFHVPESLLKQLRAPVSIQAIAGGTPLATRSFETAGDHIYECRLPETHGSARHVEFVLDRALPPSPADRRELGVLVRFANDTADPYNPFRIV